MSFLNKSSQTTFYNSTQIYISLLKKELDRIKEIDEYQATQIRGEIARLEAIMEKQADEDRLFSVLDKEETEMPEMFTGDSEPDVNEITRLRESVGSLQIECSRYRRIIDCLYDKMVKISPDDDIVFSRAITEDRISDNHVMIMNPNGEFVYAGKLNRIETEKIWKTMWGLDRV